MTNQPVTTGEPVSLNTLRHALETAENISSRPLDASNIETLLRLMDHIEAMFEDFEGSEDAVRSEQGRWATLQGRITANPQMIVAPAAKLGGLAKLRSKNQPATGFWWHLDEVVTDQRRRSMQRIGMIVGIVVVLVAVVWGGMSFFASRNVEALSLNDVTTNIEQLARDEEWAEALAMVTAARETMPDDVELMVWEAVLTEQTNGSRAPTLLRAAQSEMADEATRFWLLVGNDRLQVGNLAGAEEAGQEALMLSPQEAQATLLLGGIAEARGDTSQAAEYYNQTVVLAGEENSELGVLAKMRLGFLTPSIDPLGGAGITETVEQSATVPITP